MRCSKMAAINFAGRAPTAMPYMPSQVPGAALRSRPWGKAAVHCLAPLDALDVCCCRFWWEGRMQSCLQGCQEGLWLVAAVRAAVSCWLLLWGWLWWWPLCRRGFWRWRSRRRSYHRCVSCTGCSGWRDNSCRHGQAQAQARVGQAVGWHGYAGTVEGALPCSCVGKRVWKAEAPGRWDVTRRVPGPGCGRRAAGVTAEEAAAQADLARKGGLSPCSDVSWYGGDALR